VIHRLRAPAAVVAAGLLFCASAQDSQISEGWDFVPGEKLLLFDDFTDMPKGAAPPHWAVRKSAARLATNGRLVLTKSGQMWPNVKTWPNNFTIEQDIALEKASEPGERDFSWSFGNADEEWTWKVWARCEDDPGICRFHLDGEDNALGEGEAKIAIGKPNRFALWVQDGRIRVYFNGERLIDANQVKLKKWTHAWMETANEDGAISFGSFRIAESAADFSKSIFASGRFVTHGIHFDVNSDRLRPESAPVLKMVADALTAAAALKLRIEGHTDSTGDAAKNLDLSRRRAEAVKNALVQQFKVAAERLSTDGLGQTKPLADNATPQGREQNRRVEFVKL
jgi:outer membrane protein OmpA-like peptidoglycan-associated protein